MVAVQVPTGVAHTYGSAYNFPCGASQLPEASSISETLSHKHQVQDLPQLSSPAPVGAACALKCVIVLTSSGCRAERDRPSGG